MDYVFQDVVETHPGLTFLKDAPEFHSRYITTVGWLQIQYDRIPVMIQFEPWLQEEKWKLSNSVVVICVAILFFINVSFFLLLLVCDVC